MVTSFVVRTISPNSKKLMLQASLLAVTTIHHREYYCTNVILLFFEYVPKLAVITLPRPQAQHFEIELASAWLNTGLPIIKLIL